MKYRKKRSPKPPKDVFVSGSFISAACAAVALFFIQGTTAFGVSARNQRTAELYERFAPGALRDNLIDEIGKPSATKQVGKFRVLEFEKPSGYGFDIAAVVKGDRVVRVFTLESSRHRDYFAGHVARLNR